MSERTEQLKKEIIDLVVEFAVYHQHIQSPLVLRGLELKQLLSTQNTVASSSLEEKTLTERQLELVATAIANSTVSSVKASAVWMPETISSYREQCLLETVIEKLQNSY